MLNLADSNFFVMWVFWNPSAASIAYSQNNFGDKRIFWKLSAIHKTATQVSVNQCIPALSSKWLVEFVSLIYLLTSSGISEPNQQIQQVPWQGLESLDDTETFELSD